MKSRAGLLLRTAVVFLGVGAAAVALWRGLLLRDPRGIEDGDFGAVAPFTLAERGGGSLSLADLQGKVWVADFVFTRCGGPCPRLTRAMARLQGSFPADAPVRLVSFTVDPSYDTPAILAEYASRFGADPARWFFLTGETSAVQHLILESFRLALKENTG
jgi:protein SCO1